MKTVWALAIGAQQPGHPGPINTAVEPKQVQPPPPLSETTSVTSHELLLNGQRLQYTATARTLIFRDDAGQPNGSIFYVAYAKAGAPKAARPVTFLYNGGPPAASMWLHMGAFGPVRVVTKSPAATDGPPFSYVPNEYSLLDDSDLVFIDPPLCGYSQIIGTGSAKDFEGTDEDIAAFEKFITRWLTLNQRWNSSKFLLGESYGGARSAGLVSALENDGVIFNGVTLLSPALNYNIYNPGYDTQPISYFPTFAAVAYFYNKVERHGTLAEWVQRAREFARGPYAAALAQGDALPADQFNAIAGKVAAFTGLSLDYVNQAKLRIDAARFRKQFLRADGQTLGRYDARFEATDTDAAGETPGYDPSSFGIMGLYLAAFQEYAMRELHYASDEPYRPTTSDSAPPWNFKHHAPDGTEQTQPDMAVDLSDAMQKNPRLKVFSSTGYFDLGTPFFATEYDLHHMLLPPAIAANLSFGC